MYHSVRDLIDQAKQRGVTIGTVVLENEMAFTEKTATTLLIWTTACFRRRSQESLLPLSVSGFRNMI